jgi:hypothetical protein
VLELCGCSFVAAVQQFEKQFETTVAVASRITLLLFKWLFFCCSSAALRSGRQ